MQNGTYAPTRVSACAVVETAPAPKAHLPAGEEKKPLQHKRVRHFENDEVDSTRDATHSNASYHRKKRGITKDVRMERAHTYTTSAP